MQVVVCTYEREFTSEEIVYLAVRCSQAIDAEAIIRCLPDERDGVRRCLKERGGVEAFDERFSKAHGETFGASLPWTVIIEVEE